MTTISKPHPSNAFCIKGVWLYDCNDAKREGGGGLSWTIFTKKCYSIVISYLLICVIILICAIKVLNF